MHPVRLACCEEAVRQAERTARQAAEESVAAADAACRVLEAVRRGDSAGAIEAQAEAAVAAAGAAQDLAVTAEADVLAVVHCFDDESRFPGESGGQ